jgi:hypothetical protein
VALRSKEPRPGAALVWPGGRCGTFIFQYIIWLNTSILYNNIIKWYYFETVSIRICENFILWYDWNIML